MSAIYAYFILRMFNEYLSITSPKLVFSLIGLTINIAGNYVLMFGHLGFPALGAVGAKWGTSLVLWVMSVSASILFESLIV